MTARTHISVIQAWMSRLPNPYNGGFPGLAGVSIS